MTRTLPSNLGCAFALTFLASLPATAQNYPTRPIRFIVPAPPGGAPDALARIMGQKLTEKLAQQVVIDNRAGGNGIIGSEIAARAAPDGYNIVMGYAGPFSINPGLYDKLPYDPIKDFAPITLIAIGQNVLVAHPSFPARTVEQGGEPVGDTPEEFAAYIKSEHARWGPIIREAKIKAD